MKIYLTMSSIPELAALPPNERRLAWAACHRHTRTHWQVRLGTILAAVIGLLAGAGLLMIVLNLSPFDQLVNFFIAGFACGAAIVATFEFVRTLVVSSQIRPYLREYIAQRAAHRVKPAREKVELDFAGAPFDDD